MAKQGSKWHTHLGIDTLPLKSTVCQKRKATRGVVGPFRSKISQSCLCVRPPRRVAARRAVGRRRSKGEREISDL